MTFFSKLLMVDRGWGPRALVLYRTVLYFPLMVLSVVLYLPLVVADVMFQLIGPFVRRRLVLAPVDTSRVTIIIVSWNGRDLLAAGLPSVVRAASNEGGQHEVLVVDNGSTDKSVEFVREHFPGIDVLALPRNYGFSEGNNAGARRATRDVVVFLNNDMVVDQDFLAPLLAQIRKNNVFAVGSQIFFQDAKKSREETGFTHGAFVRGRLEMRHDQITDSESRDDNLPILWASGGAAAVHREGFLSLGGFDTIYSPFYWEDADLSYRAWKAGWRCLLAPESRVLHRHRASTSRFGLGFVDATVRKNEYIFIWKNIASSRWLLVHFCWLAIHATHETASKGFVFALDTLGRAIRQYPEMIRGRYGAARSAVRTDEEVFNLANTRLPVEGTPILDFEVGAHQRQIGAGWHSLEGEPGQKYRWMSEEAEGYVYASGYETKLEIVGFVPELSLPSGLGVQKLTVTVGDRAVCTGKTVLMKPFRFQFPLPHTCRGWTEIHLRAAYCHVPADIGLGSDKRELSLCITRLALI